MDFLSYGSTDVAKNLYEIDQELGSTELSLSDCAREWGIDLQERKKLQILGGVPEEGAPAWIQVKLKRAEQEHSMASERAL